jgi:hypothetical protein
MLVFFFPFLYFCQSEQCVPWCSNTSWCCPYSLWVLSCRCPLQAKNSHNMSQSVYGHHWFFFFSQKEMYWAKGKQGEKKRKKYINLRYVLVVLFFKIFKIGKTWQFIYFLKRKISLVYCLQFYVRLGPKSPLDERQIVH